MSRINLSENLFIGVQELQMFQNNCMNYLNIFGMLAKTFGLIENKDALSLSKISDADRESFKATSPGNLQLQFTTPSYAFAYPNKLICWDKNKVVTLPDSYKGKTYWVRISYAENVIEEGTLRMDGNGNITGTSTFFTDKLRGEPNFPSRIKLYTFNGSSFDEKGIYVVESVNSDTSIKIYSETGTIGDITLTYYYSVVGTWPIGSNPTEDEINPFRYDSCQLEFLEETTTNEAPENYVMKNSNDKFYVARITIDSNGALSIQDKRFIYENEDSMYSKWFSLK